ncbi:hypothetical protein EDC94DRAFT_585261 [Helicostylum pulchrum]|uniref:Uncharacterized protein n=1 Tax=Helicostylum pulchrum TaxID=562976 RepID=A0ABP9Y9I6_9FUNG|nr:hypothetical protein EDC94DRAFT_585261 [Helicostylum pulchrum]
MKEDRQVDGQEEDMEVELTSAEDMRVDIVEEFARQLDEVVRIQSDEEEDDDDFDNFGYEPLPQDDDEDMYQQLESDEEDAQDPLNIDVDSSASLKPETSDLIKSIMANIQLSDEAVPDWAKKIPESAWLPRVNQKKD